MMTIIYDKNSRKKATNLTINSNLLQREKWEEENKQSLIQYNDRIKNNGLFSDGLRSF